MNWLQQQELPNSKGSMGITEAQNILSNQPDLDHAYQKRFLECKMRGMEQHFGAHGLPSSAKEMEDAFQNTKAHITPLEEQSSFKAIETQANQEGVGQGFKVDSKIKDTTKEQLSLIQDRLDRQEEGLKKQAAERKAEIERKTQ